MLKSTNEFYKGHEFTCLCVSPKYLYDTCDQVPPSLKNEKDRSVEYKNNTKTNQSSIWTSPCTQFLSKRTQM